MAFQAQAFDPATSFNNANIMASQSPTSMNSLATSQSNQMDLMAKQQDLIDQDNIQKRLVQRRRQQSVNALSGSYEPLPTNDIYDMKADEMLNKQYLEQSQTIVAPFSAAINAAAANYNDDMRKSVADKLAEVAKQTGNPYIDMQAKLYGALKFDSANNVASMQMDDKPDQSNYTSQKQYEADMRTYDSKYKVARKLAKTQDEADMIDSYYNSGQAVIFSRKKDEGLSTKNPKETVEKNPIVKDSILPEMNGEAVRKWAAEHKSEFVSDGVYRNALTIADRLESMNLKDKRIYKESLKFSQGSDGKIYAISGMEKPAPGPVVKNIFPTPGASDKKEQATSLAQTTIHQGFYPDVTGKEKGALTLETEKALKEHYDGDNKKTYDAMRILSENTKRGATIRRLKDSADLAIDTIEGPLTTALNQWTSSRDFVDDQKKLKGMPRGLFSKSESEVEAWMEKQKMSPELLQYTAATFGAIRQINSAVSPRAGAQKSLDMEHVFWSPVQSSEGLNMVKNSFLKEVGSAQKAYGIRPLPLTRSEEAEKKQKDSTTAKNNSYRVDMPYKEPGTPTMMIKGLAKDEDSGNVTKIYVKDLVTGQRYVKDLVTGQWSK